MNRETLVLSSLFFLLSCCLFSQTTTTFSADQDSYVDSRYASGNYGGLSNLEVNTYLPTFSRTWYFRRSFVSFSLDSIPSNAVISSATIVMKRSTSISGSNPFRVKRVTSFWHEDTVTFSAQPSISALTEDISSSYTQSNDTLFFDVTAMTQRMVYGSADNYGWSIQLNNEALTSASGCSFYSSESSYVPALKIVWYLPLSISACTITHESGSGASDGAISPTIAGGAGGLTYSWTNAAGVEIGTSSTISGLPYGWYGLSVHGSFGATLYYAFLVGQECANVEIDFQPDRFFTKNCYITDQTNGSSIDMSDDNFGEHTRFIASNFEQMGYHWSDVKSLLKFNIWIPDDLTINQGDLTLYGATHVNTTSNISKLTKINSSWNEFLVTWDTPPSTIGTSITVPATTSSSQNSTIDILDYLESWQTNNSTNQGIQFELQYYDDDDDETQWYRSPSYTTPSQRPKIEFEVSLLHEDDPYVCNPLYAGLERKLTGINYKTVLEKVYFYYDSEYGTGSTDLDYAVYVYSDQITPVLDGTVESLDKGFGRNQYKLNVDSLSPGAYVLVVTNEKNEKRYLRFIQE